MKAFIIFNDNTEQTVKGKDIRLHRDGPGEFHLTDAYHNHRVLAAFANVREVAMQGKPKKAKQKAPTVETLKITVDTTELVAGLKSAMLEIEELVDSTKVIHKDQITDDYLDANLSREELAMYGITTCRADRDHAYAQVAELRENLDELMRAKPQAKPTPVATSAPAPIPKDAVQMPVGETGVAFLNTAPRTTLDLADELPSMLDAPMPSDCTCPPKRNIEVRGHISGCTYNSDVELPLMPDCEPKPGKE